MSRIQEFILDLFDKLYESFIEPFLGLLSLYDLIYAGPEGKKVWGAFSEDAFEKALIPGIELAWGACWFFVILGIILGGARIASSGINPSNRTAVLESMKDWAIVSIVLANLVTFYQILFSFNEALVTLFKVEEDSLLGSVSFENLSNLGSGVGWIFVGLVLLGITLWANFYYFMRTFTLLLFMIAGPFMVALYLFPQTKGITLNWLRELTGTVLIQAIHAFLFWTMAIISAGNTSAIETTLMYIVFIPVAEALRNVLRLGGDTTGKLSSFASMAGLAGLAGMYGSIKGALGGQNTIQSLRRAATGIKDAATQVVKGEKGALRNATTSASRMLRAGDITSKMGKASLGMAGAIAGTALGPKGSLITSAVAGELGGAAGSVAGRLGYTAGLGAKKGINALKKGVTGSLKGAKEGLDAVNEDKNLDKLAVMRTNKWAKENKDSFVKGYRAKDPNATPEDIDKAWNQRLQEKKDQFKRDAHNLLNPSKGNNYVKASELAKQMAEKATDDWAKDNKEHALNSMKLANPNMTDDQLQEAWKKELSRQHQNNLKMANEMASNMTGGDLNRLVNKNDFAKQFAAQRLKEMDGDIKINQLDNPLTEQSLAQMKGDKQQQYLTQAQHALGSMSDAQLKTKDGLNKSAIAQQMASKLTDQWRGNEQAFKANMAQKHPELSQEQIEAIWKRETAGKYQAYLSDANNALKSLSIDKALNKDGTVNKEAIAQHLSKEMANSWADKGTQLLNKTQQMAQQVSGTPLVSHGHVNRESAASAMATQMLKDYAAQNEQTFKHSLEHQNPKITGNEIEEKWQSHLNDKYKDYYEQAYNTVPQTFGQSKGKMVLSATSSALKGAYAGSGLKSVAQSVANFAPVKYTTSAIQGALIGVQNALSEARTENLTLNPADAALNSLSKATVGLGQGVVSGVNLAKDQIEANRAENAVQKQINFRNGAAFAVGAITGVAGYEKAGEFFTNNMNPYAKHANQQTSEVTDIARMAKKTVVSTPKGPKEVIADDAIQLVVEPDRSYIQVTDQNGARHVVSKYGAGDSSLKKGEVLYQDLTIQNGALVNRTIPGVQHTAYKKDSAGGKILVNRELNISANDLVANRRPVENPQTAPFYDPYNSQVDTGQFTIEQIQKVAQKGQARLVVEKDRSYITVQDSTGKHYRVSQYGPGDPLLSSTEVYYKDYKIENGWFTPSTSEMYAYEYDEFGKRHEMVRRSPVNIEELVPYKVNKRVERRKQIEMERHKQGVW